MTQVRDLRLHWVAGLAAAGLWIASAVGYELLSRINPGPHQFVGHVVPQTISLTVWHWPSPWIILAPLTSTLVLFVAYVVLARLVAAEATSPRAPQFFALWFAAVAAGVLATVPWAAGMTVADFPPPRAAFLFNAAGDSLLLSAYWGFAWGWLPALVVTRGLRRPGSADDTRRRTLAAFSGLLVLAMVLSGAGVVLGARAARTEVATQAAIEAGHTIGALPDPFADVTPPPDVAPGDHDIDPGWCTADQSMLLLGGQDAAAGHRVLSIRLMNFSDEPCVLRGYPDVAFSDQNGSLLEVTLRQGSAFLTDDPGPVELTVPAGGYALTELGWDAMATTGDAAYTLHAAPYPGAERGSWPVTLDITDEGEVSLTAWRLSDAGS